MTSLVLDESELFTLVQQRVEAAIQVLENTGFDFDRWTDDEIIAAIKTFARADDAFTAAIRTTRADEKDGP